MRVGLRDPEGVEVAAGPGPLEGPGSEDRLLALDVPAPPVPLDPVGFLGTVPVWGLTTAAGLWLPVEIGGELAFMVIEVLRPKHTLSLALGVDSSRADPPEVVSSLFVGKIGLGGGLVLRSPCPELGRELILRLSCSGFVPVGFRAMLSSPEAMVRLPRLPERLGEGKLIGIKGETVPGWAEPAPILWSADVRVLESGRCGVPLARPDVSRGLWMRALASPEAVVALP